MQELIAFEMNIKKKIPEVMAFVSKKMLDEKMVSYCGNRRAFHSCGDPDNAAAIP